MKHELYQGWYNAQTWCVALTMDNTKALQDKALVCVADNLEHPLLAESALRSLASKHVTAVHEMAPWAWSDLQTLTGDVNWSEIREHYETKYREELHDGTKN